MIKALQALSLKKSYLQLWMIGFDDIIYEKKQMWLQQMWGMKDGERNL